ncbi:MAG: alpha/beta fold hydrolase, partial [Prochlorococcaceae cyanobacterium]
MRAKPQPAKRVPASGHASASDSGDADWGRHSRWMWRGQSCHWRVLGEPSHPPLLLVHGFGAASGHWRRNAAALAAAGWLVYGIDLIGFGASSQP